MGRAAELIGGLTVGAVVLLLAALARSDALLCSGTLLGYFTGVTLVGWIAPNESPRGEPP